jgi:hypothetical protein
MRGAAARLHPHNPKRQLRRQRDFRLALGRSAQNGRARRVETDEAANTLGRIEANTEILMPIALLENAASVHLGKAGRAIPSLSSRPTLVIL